MTEHSFPTVREVSCLSQRSRHFCTHKERPSRRKRCKYCGGPLVTRLVTYSVHEHSSHTGDDRYRTVDALYVPKNGSERSAQKWCDEHQDGRLVVRSESWGVVEDE